MSGAQFFRNGTPPSTTYCGTHVICKGLEVRESPVLELGIRQILVIDGDLKARAA